MTDREAAEAAGVNRVTVTNWRNHSPLFAAELNRRRQELWACSADRLRSLLPRALDTLDEEMKTGKDRARIALEVLRLAGFERVAGKGGTLERYNVGPTTAEAFIDAHARGQRPDPFSEIVDGEAVTEAERRAAADRLMELAGSAV